MSTFDLHSSPAITTPDLFAPPVPVSAAEVQPDASPEEQAAAALVHLTGASSLTLEAFTVSAPPNLAAASALVAELSARAGVAGAAALDSVYTLMDERATLALTGE